MNNETVRLTPKGTREHGQIKRGRVIATRANIERLLGPAHAEGDGTHSTAEWFLQTDLGSATVYNNCAFSDEEYGIDAVTDRVALLTVSYLRTNKLEAHYLGGQI